MIENVKDMKCGLIGKKLSHSFSPMIHSYLADYSYSFFELEEHELEAFVTSDSFDCANVTIPYKIKVMQYLDHISEEAKRIGSVNTVVRRNGKLFGYNTDHYGFCYMLKAANIDVKDKNVLILGNGGSSLTARAACGDLHAKRIDCVSRSGDLNYENVYDARQDTEIIINCTPVGMYPNNGERLIDLSRFKHLTGVADIIFNPSKTRLLLDAEAMGIRCTNGLSMLCAQAKRACEIFCDGKICDSEIERICNIISRETKNIVLIGMPGSGKSTVGRILADKLSRRFIDTDEEIEKAVGMSIPKIFDLYGEEGFRKFEHEATIAVTKQSGAVIATGGGIIKRKDNTDALRQNSTVVFIRRDINALSCDGRPLSKKDKMQEMYAERAPLYLGACDIALDNDDTPNTCAKRIIDEIYSHK